MAKLASKVRVCVPIQGGFIGGITVPSGNFCLTFLLKSVDHFDAHTLRGELLEFLSRETLFLEFGRAVFVGLNPPSMFTSEDLVFRVSDRLMSRLFNSLSRRFSHYGFLLSIALEFGSIELTFERLSALSRAERGFLKAAGEPFEEGVDE